MENIMDIDIAEIIERGSDTVVYCLAAFVLLFAGKLVFQLINKNINVNEELVEKDNFAFAIQFVGYLFGLLLAIGAAIEGPSAGMLEDLKQIGIYGGLGIVFLNLAGIVSDKIILRKFSVRKEICDDKNEGVGVVTAANYVASGLIIFGAVSGEGPLPSTEWHTLDLNVFLFGGEGGGIETAAVCWLVGQVLLILASEFYNFITPYSTHDELEKDNVAVGIGFGGAIVAFSILILNAIKGDFESYTATFTNLGIEFVIGLVLLPSIRLIADKVLLPGQDLTDELVNQEKPNLGAAFVEAFAYIGGAILITWCL